MSTVPKHYITPEEYLHREKKAEFRSEYFRGEMFAMAGASANHNLIVGNCIQTLGQQLKNTEAYDRGKKFEHYRTIPSLKHYVLIAQDRHSIDCFTRSADGSWNLTSCQGLDGKIKLEALDSELVGAEVYDKVVFAS